MSRVLLINGSPQGSAGNTCVLLEHAARYFASQRIEIDTLVLAEASNSDIWRSRLQRANLIVIGTGTYWDSWGSPLQRFWEQMTDTEGSELWLGKPAGVLVSMHSVGGKAVLSRLQGVLNSLGCLIPPMSGMVYSALGHALTQAADASYGPAFPSSSIAEDIWQLADIEVIAHNLVQAFQGTNHWRTWPVDDRDYAARWL